MMTRRNPRRNTSRLPLVTGPERTKIRNNPIYLIRGYILLCILLRVFPQKTSPHTTNLMHMTTTRNSTTKPILRPPSKHSRSPSLRSHSHLSSPQPNLRKQLGSNHRPNMNKGTWSILHLPSTKRIYRRPIHNRR